MEEQTVDMDIELVDDPEVQPAVDTKVEVRDFLGRLQYDLQVLLSALVLESQAPSLLASTPIERNNIMRGVLARQLDAIPHLMEHINNGN